MKNSLADLSDIQSSVVISLASRKRHDKVDGYWVDALEGLKFGSLLKLLSASKQNQETLLLAESYAFEALKWLTDRGLVKDIKVDARFVNNVLTLSIIIDNEVAIDYVV